MEVFIHRSFQLVELGELVDWCNLLLTSLFTKAAVILIKQEYSWKLKDFQPIQDSFAILNKYFTKSKSNKNNQSCLNI